MRLFICLFIVIYTYKTCLFNHITDIIILDLVVIDIATKTTKRTILARLKYWIISYIPLNLNF